MNTTKPALLSVEQGLYAGAGIAMIKRLMSFFDFYARTPNLFTLEVHKLWL